MFKVFFRDIALQELEEANDWYEGKQKGLGDRFLSEIDNCINHLKENPQLFAKRKRNYREAIIKSFPFVLLYKIDKEAKAVIILSVFHTKRNPKNKHRNRP
jgi:mRNA-degrading endonuclease RelE of RelBE toxin-antitoxin system